MTVTSLAENAVIALFPAFYVRGSSVGRAEAKDTVTDSFPRKRGAGCGYLIQASGRWFESIPRTLKAGGAENGYLTF